MAQVRSLSDQEEEEEMGVCLKAMVWVSGERWVRRRGEDFVRRRCRRRFWGGGGWWWGMGFFSGDGELRGGEGL